MARSNPAAPFITGCLVRLSLYTTTQGQQCITTLDYNDPTPGAPALADLANLATAFIAAMTTPLKNVLSPLTTLQWVLAQELSFGVTPSVQQNFPGAVVGVAGASNLPLEMAARLSRYSSLKGQHGRGAISMPAVPNTFTTPATDPNTINAVGVAAYTALIAGLIATIPTGGRVWSPFISTRPTRPATLVSRGVPTSFFILRTNLVTVRRRRPGRGI